MLIKRGRYGPGGVRPSEITSHTNYLNRREFVRDMLVGAGAATVAPGLLFPAAAHAGTPLTGVAKSTYQIDEAITNKKDVLKYNNFYEFGTGKDDPSQNSGAFKPKPWSIEIAGACARPGQYALEDILKPNTLEERVYRLRCVERWSMVIPWVGIPLANVLSRFEPTSNARYVAFTTVYRPEEMPGQKQPILDWPYVEGLRIDEAMHPLTLLTVGVYGEELPNQNGAPVRLVVPWKYGFKSIKSVVKIEFTENEPPTSWNRSLPNEYGFYSNVNPKVDHPRWSQAKERRIGDFFKRKTLMFNGYAEEVASLYKGMDLKKHY
jgi:sulfoxide reductase catalytic subunit YedY